MNDVLTESLQLRKNAKQMLLGQQQAGNKPIIAVWGLMNVGKSSLLNMLTEHIDSEYFKTNDFRETAEIKTCSFNDMIFLDTPGLDANNADDMEAMRGVARADVVLFVHQPQGALEQIEMDFLKNLKTSFGENAETNIILVISKVDKESPEKIQAIENEMLAQCQDILGFTPKCFQISNTRFHKGVNEHKNGLTQASHINELNEHLYKVAKASVGVNQKRNELKLSELSDELNGMIAEMTNQKKQTMKNLADEFVHFNQLMKGFREYVTDIQERYEDI